MQGDFKSIDELLNEPKPSPTSARDRCHELATVDPQAALQLARSIDLPWYRSQALSWIARYSECEASAIAREAAVAAACGDDAYQRVAVRAWEIAALAERGLLGEARCSLNDALAGAPFVEPSASRAEALIILLHAALRIGEAEGDRVCAELVSMCGGDYHWRCKRALRDAHELCSGKTKPREFFW